MKDFDFSPMVMTIKAGGTVTWKNLDGEPHRVVHPDGFFRAIAANHARPYRSSATYPRLKRCGTAARRTTKIKNREKEARSQ
jgi:plastocyanin